MRSLVNVIDDRCTNRHNLSKTSSTWEERQRCYTTTDWKNPISGEWWKTCDFGGVMENMCFRGLGNAHQRLALVFGQRGENVYLIVEIYCWFCRRNQLCFNGARKQWLLQTEQKPEIKERGEGYNDTSLSSLSLVLN